MEFEDNIINLKEFLDSDFDLTINEDAMKIVNVISDIDVNNNLDIQQIIISCKQLLDYELEYETALLEIINIKSDTIRENVIDALDYYYNFVFTNCGYELLQLINKLSNKETK